jgi:hypothetical protein
MSTSPICRRSDPWIVNADGTGLRHVAETGADEPSVVWSPDATQLFVYSGTGSYVLDVATECQHATQLRPGLRPGVWLATN